MCFKTSSPFYFLCRCPPHDVQVLLRLSATLELLVPDAESRDSRPGQPRYRYQTMHNRPSIAIGLSRQRLTLTMTRIPPRLTTVARSRTAKQKQDSSSEGF
jgi:hypothetical protein